MLQINNQSVYPVKKLLLLLIFTEQQTRSSDEAMTIKATCLKCGKKFNI